MMVIDTEELDLILIQEPYEYQSRTVGFDKYRIFTAGKGKHRTVTIITNSNTDALLNTKLSDEDTVIWEIIHKNIQFYATSMDFDIEDQTENKFTKMDAISRLAKHGRILIAADRNAQSKMWHDVKTNSRGKKLEEYLVSKQLHIINEESETFTFHNYRGTSNIDLTITNDKLTAAVNEWEISPDESLSDHKYIKYKI
jgi:exonuclease III